MESDINSSNAMEATQKPSAVARIFKVFTEPSKAFENFSGKTDWLIPFIVIVIIGGAIAHFTRPIYVESMTPKIMERVEAYRQYMSEEQYNETIARIEEGQREAMENPFKWYTPLVMIGIPLLFLIVISAIGLLSGNFVFGGKSSFWVVMSVIAFAALVGLLGDLVRGIMIMAKHSAYVYTGLGLLKPVDDGSILYYLIRQVDLFSIWRIAVTSIGLGVVYKIKTGKFASALYIIWIIFIVIVALLNKYIMAGGLVY
jgi:hypothetical protein